ncbi:hypothetical protein Strvi_6453 [Streptomyces violaceusniger Tu 4113]|uniref:Uncharacterized protein n=1 Tax=Streptomyces violaceusniger (strain Tu 4113) TaxID=653045 RepID=G2NVJ8_STRV4|nr:hypothetical protein Strvi_6453 [Streptomyces violaceusniger Tu 4113]
MRNNGVSNVADECGDAALSTMSAHDAAVCQSGYAAQEWAKAQWPPAPWGPSLGRCSGEVRAGSARPHTDF